MLKTLCLVLALALAACGGKKDDKKKDADKTAASAAPAANKAAADLFTGPNVSLPAPAAKLSLGMAEADAKAAAPDLVGKPYKVPDVEGVELNTQLSDGRVYQIFAEIKQPVDTVKEWLTKKWSAPRETKSSIGDPLYYFDDPEVGLRAVLEKKVEGQSYLRYYKVTSIEQILGTGETLGFVTRPLVGMTPEEVMSTYAEYNPTPRKDDPDSILLNLAPVKTSEHGNTVDVRIKDGQATGFTLSLNTGGDAAADALVAKRFEEVFGKGKLDSNSLYTDYPGPPKAKAELRKDSASFAHTLWVGDTKK